MKNILGILVFALLFVSLFIFPLQSSEAAIIVRVYVRGIIDGNLAYIKFDKILNNTPLDLTIDWENQGSVGCRVRFRADFYHEAYSKKEPVYIAWSKELPLEPGDHAPFEILFYPKNSGNYSAKIFVYYCNLIKEVKEINFTAYTKFEKKEKMIKEFKNESFENLTSKNKTTLPKKYLPFEVIETKNTENYVEFKIKAKENLSNLAIIPVEYPLGWIFESKKVERFDKGEERYIRVGYVPSIFKERRIGFDLVTLDGKYHVVEYVNLKKKKESYFLNELKKFLMERNKFNLLLILIIVILILLIIIKGRKSARKKRKENKGKK